MSESFNDPSSHPFTCKLPDGSVIGGSYDNLSAVTIACTLYAIIQAANPVTTGAHQLSVSDDTGTVIAVIGRGG